MNDLAEQVISLLRGKTLATAESCTGGGIGAALTAVSGSSAVFKGGIISYCNEIKHALLGVSEELLICRGAVSAHVAEEMALGAKNALQTDIAVSVTGLAGPGGDAFGNPVGTVFVGYADDKCCISQQYHFAGDRNNVRQQAITSALLLILEMNR
jgi:nicotinamide-nucleotide amidase